MRKLIYLVAVTADGFIASADGSFDWYLKEGEHLAELFSDYPETLPGAARSQLGITAQNRVFDAVLMGRNTYEVGASQGITSPYPQLAQYLFSRSLQRSPDPAVTLVTTDPASFVRELKQQPGAAIWLCGGSQLASELFAEIDELVLKQNPSLIGAGIPLFARRVPTTQMSLIDRKLYPSGFQRLHYRLQHT